MQWIYTHGGVFPVRRGHGDEEAFITANAVLDHGGTVVMYCEGGRSRSGRLSELPRPDDAADALAVAVAGLALASLERKEVLFP